MYLIVVRTCHTFTVPTRRRHSCDAIKSDADDVREFSHPRICPLSCSGSHHHLFDDHVDIVHTLHTPISITPSTSFFFFTHCQVDHGIFCLHTDPSVTVRRRYKCIHARVGFQRDTKLRHNVTRSQDCQHWRRYAFEYTCSSR